MILVYRVIGVVSLGTGVVGVFLPLLPTTPFLLLACICFSKSSPRLHLWLVQHPHFGPPIRDWQSRGVIRLRMKVLALVSMAIGLVTVWLKATAGGLLFQSVVTLCMVVISIFIVTRPSR